MVPDFAQSLYRAFEREGIPLLLAGGWAVCHHGYSRLTLDVDWVCARSNEERATALMDSLGFDQSTDGMAARFKYRKVLAFPFVDLIWVDDSSFRRMSEPDPALPAESIPVINFRALLAMKIYALKDHDHRQGKDLLDIRSLLDYGHCKISDSELLELCMRYGSGSTTFNLIKFNQ